VKLRKFAALSTFLMVSHLVVGNTNASNFDDFTVQVDEFVGDQPVQDYVNTWWQWSESMPKQLSPVRDYTGKHCHVGQKGEVWFLAGGYGSSTINRQCEIPYGKHVFFPIINMLYYPRYEGSTTCDRVKEKAALNNDHLLDIYVELDGVAAWNPASSRMSSSKCFDLLGLIPEKYNAPEVFPSATDGYWVMLKPLSRGQHILRFQAGYGRENSNFGQMMQDIEYEIIVR